MNWDISIGRSKQWLGRVMQSVGQRFDSRQMVLDGEAMEYAGRLQTRYGLLKHEAQWRDHSRQMRPQAISIESPTKKSISL